MIKLIATDLDGSLLDDNKQLPPDFETVLSQLKDMGIAFAAVSGRNFDAIHPTLGDSINTMICVCNNGANIYEKGVNTVNHPITTDQVHRTLDAIKNMENTVPLLFTMDKCFGVAGPQGFMEWAQRPYSPLEWLDSYGDFYKITDDVYKISVYDGSGDIENYSYPVIRKAMERDTAVYVSGEIWVDIVSNKASKGYGLQLIMDKLGVKKEETMAFGDYFNDETLLAAAGWPFVMENGVQLLKDRYSHHAGSNNNGGVTKAIREYVIEKTKTL